MEEGNNISNEQSNINNIFCTFYSSEANIYVKILFLDLLYQVFPSNCDYYVYKLEINELDDSLENEHKNLGSYDINEKNSTYDIKLKRRINDPCCLYQYFEIKMLFMKDKIEQAPISYIVPIYYNKENVIFSLFYGYGLMSFEIIIRRDTFYEIDWIREPELGFVIGNNFLRMKAKENFDKQSSRKRFVFININSYDCFPNLNLGKYTIFKYSKSTSNPSLFTIYIDEYFNHIGFFMLKKDLIKEYKVNINQLMSLYDKCKQLKNYIDLINQNFDKENYNFRDSLKDKINKAIDNMHVTSEEVNNFALFLRQNILMLKEEGKKLIFQYSYFFLLSIFNENVEYTEYYDYIIILFVSFQNQLKNKFEDKLVEMKLLYTVSEFLREYLKDDFIKNMKKIVKRELAEKKLIRLIDFSDNNIYSFVENNNYEIINNLKEDSYLFYILNQLNSSIGKNMIHSSYYTSGDSTCSMITMITLDDFKKEFESIKQRYGIKIGFNTCFNAVTNILTKITIYNENKIFGEFLKINEVKDDPNYVLTLKLSTSMKHERFTHTLVSINIFTGNLKGSPEEYLDFQNGTKLELVTDGKQESGNAFEYLLTRDIDFSMFLHSPPVNPKLKQFFDYNLWIESTMSGLNDLYLKIIDENKKNETNNSPNVPNRNKNIGYSTQKVCGDNYCDIFKNNNNSNKFVKI